MTYVLTNAHVVPVQLEAKATRKVAAKPGLLARFYAAMIESRTRSAEREIRARQLVINEAGIVMGGIPFATLSSDAALPFNR